MKMSRILLAILFLLQTGIVITKMVNGINYDVSSLEATVLLCTFLIIDKMEKLK